jgi:hypothetical protein
MLKHFSIYEREKQRKNSEQERTRNKMSIVLNPGNNQNKKSSVMNQELLNALLKLGI